MRKLLIAILLFLTSISLWSQEQLHGYVYDLDSLALVEHPVFIKIDSIVIDTVYTDESGRYNWAVSVHDSLIFVQTVGFCGAWVLYSDTVKLGADFSKDMDFPICHDATEESCNAIIKYNKDSAKSISFESKSRGLEYLKYFWDFGDGTYSNSSTPHHEFEKEGVYLVKLIVENPLGCVDSVFIEVLATDKSFIRGKLKFTEHYLSNAFIWLIGFDEKQNTVLQRVNANERGGFDFFCEANSHYLVKIVPDFEEEIYPRVLPTYLGGVLNWQDAEVLDIGHEILDVDLFAKVSYKQLHGFNSIYGSFEFLVPSELLPLNVLLLDEDSIPINHAIVENGQFSFSGLEKGSYYVLPECPGKISKALRIDFHEDFDVPVYRDFIVSNTKIAPTSIINKSEQVGPSVYPLPFSDVLYIETSTVINYVQIIDVTGIIVEEYFLRNEDKVKLNTEHLHKGNYILRCFYLDKSSDYRLIVK